MCYCAMVENIGAGMFGAVEAMGPKVFNLHRNPKFWPLCKLALSCYAPSMPICRRRIQVCGHLFRSIEEAVHFCSRGCLSCTYTRNFAGIAVINSAEMLTPVLGKLRCIRLTRIE